jgi:hypothetical protein
MLDDFGGGGGGAWAAFTHPHGVPNSFDIVEQVWQGRVLNL